jgi:hypothetical protein
MKKHILASAAGISLLIGSQAFGFYSTDFSTVNTFSNSGVDSSLGDGGDGGAFAYNTWWYSSGNGGINVEGQGRKDGLNPSAAGNDLDTFGQNNPQAGAGTNGRANWIVFDGSNFTAGEQYTISFDVIGGSNRDGADAGTSSGRMWVTELSGYDNSGSNYIQMDGSQTGWNNSTGATNVPFFANGTAVVNYLTVDDAIAGPTTNGQNIVGENLFTVDGGTGDIIPTITASDPGNTFTFTYTDGTNATDIGFAIGTYNNNFGIDNFEIAVVPEPSTYALLAGCFALASVMIRRRR